MNDVMKIVKSLDESSFTINFVSGTIKNEVKEQEGGLLRILLGTLGFTLLWNLSTGIAQLELTRILNAASFFNKF